MVKDKGAATEFDQFLTQPLRTAVKVKEQVFSYTVVHVLVYTVIEKRKNALILAKP